MRTTTGSVGNSGSKVRVVLSIDAKLLDVYTAAAANNALDRNSVIVASLRIAAVHGEVGTAVEMARDDNGNTSRAQRVTESWKQRRRQRRSQKAGIE